MEKKKIVRIRQGCNNYLKDKVTQLRNQRNHLLGLSVDTTPDSPIIAPIPFVAQPSTPLTAGNVASMNASRAFNMVRPTGLCGIKRNDRPRHPSATSGSWRRPPPAPSPAPVAPTPAHIDVPPPTDRSPGEIFTRIMNAPVLASLDHSFTACASSPSATAKNCSSLETSHPHSNSNLARST
jgi:hypothetical protein